ncbi:Zinc finger protein 26 [Araneus ventricosus]|uniref:Zinc finger protein 26 n=1 Tax=Araneus ventricosus TaxID=182803 RepID=A0A4Y2U6W0_ARAVE|nr:Zinc finger protein 26 [Araneus ventricosus]
MSETILGCYICGYCDLKFKDQTDLDLHNQLHDGNGQFSCPLCKESFPDLQQLELHDLQHSLEEVDNYQSSANITFLRPASSFICKICNELFLSDEELFEHVIQHEESIVPLPKDSESFDIIKLEVDHEAHSYLFEQATLIKKNKTKRSVNKRHSKSKIADEYKCNICKKVFNAVSYLTRHQNIYHKNKKTITVREADLNENSPIRINSDKYASHAQLKTLYKCKTCKKLFNGPASLRRHENLFHMNKTSGTDVEVDLDPSLYDEIYPVSSDEETPDQNSYVEVGNVNECKACKKFFNTAPSYRRHMRRFHLNKRKYTCNVCNKMFLKMHLLSKHSLVHNKTDNDEFECRICKKHYSQSVILLQHIFVAHADHPNPFCYACFKIFPTEDDVNRHMEEHIMIRTFDCEVCKKRFKNQMLLEKHKCVSDGPRPFLCKVCGRRFLRIYHLEKHLAVHKRKKELSSGVKNISKGSSDEKPYECEKCEKHYRTETALNKHRCDNNGPRTFVCKECGKRFNRIYHLQRHEELHNRTEPVQEPIEFDLSYFKRQKSVDLSNTEYPVLKPIKKVKTEENEANVMKRFDCYICGKRWSGFQKYKQHFSTVHKDVKFNSCHICSKEFSKSSRVKRHLVTHYKEKSFRCSNCSKTFLSVPALNQHIQEQECESRLTCYQCSKTFTDKTGFQKHIAMHENSKDADFECTICKEKFSEEKLLNEHILEYHDFFKDYPCNVCHRKFNNSYHLNRHMLVHTGVKKFKCFKCNSTFDSKLKLKTHILSHEEAKPFPCYYCDKFFSRDYHRQKHLTVCSKRQITSD